MKETVFQTNGTEHIRFLIEEAIGNESRTATVTGAWEIDDAIRIPSNFTLILENCHIRMADGTFSNLFVNEHHGTEIGKRLREPTRTLRSSDGERRF